MTAFIERIQFKASFEFLSKLNQYLIHIENNYFTFTELRVGIYSSSISVYS